MSYAESRSRVVANRVPGFLAIKGIPRGHRRAIKPPIVPLVRLQSIQPQFQHPETVFQKKSASFSPSHRAGKAVRCHADPVQT
jgi:hypothetical protein